MSIKTVNDQKIKDFTDPNAKADKSDDIVSLIKQNVAASPLFANPDAKGGIDFLINYNEENKDGPQALFRESQTQALMACLIGTLKPNALLVGMAGVGKTKIVESLAYLLANDHPSLPSQLKDHVIYELPLSSIIAGSGIVGELETKLRETIDFIADPANKAILFIDEIHQITDDKKTTYSQIAEILKPALARSDIRVIGATTLQESRKFLTNPAFDRRFTRIIIDELSNDQTVEIVAQFSQKVYSHYSNEKAELVVKPELFAPIVRIANNYSPASLHRPDNALTLLDRTAAHAIIERKQKENMLQDQPELLTALQTTNILITEKMLTSTAMKMLTGATKAPTFEPVKIKQALSSIYGQDQVIATLMRELVLSNREIFPKKSPLTFLFAGKSGVGKTEVAKILARELTDNKPIMLNMTEFHSSASINRIIGSPSGYVGSESNQELPFDRLEANPYQVILLDEFEKGHQAVQRLFMKAFDEGSFETNRGKTVDFSKAIIIATTNASHTYTKSQSIGFIPDFETEAQKQKREIDSLRDFFDIELLNRFTHILTFAGISAPVYTDIIISLYEQEVERIISENRHLAKVLPKHLSAEEAIDICKKTYQPDFGARPAFRAVRKFIEDKILTI